MLAPQGKLQGLAWRTVNGIVQLGEVKTLDRAPLQELVLLQVPFACFIFIEYAVIGEPPLYGAVQFITTFVSEIDVVGAMGVLGT